MTITQHIRTALGYLGRSEASLARDMGTSPSALNQRMATGKFTSEELEKIADALGAKFVCYFEFEDGTRL